MTQTDEKRQTGYIYAIRSFQTELIYIGATFQPLRKRLYGHRSAFKLLTKGHMYSSFEILKYEDHYIELVETLENINKKELQRCEGQHIRKNDCVNKVISGRTVNEYCEKNKEYNKKYYETHKESITANQKKYTKINRDEILKKKSVYREKEAENINQRRRDKMTTCECGCVVNFYILQKHKQTSKHLSRMTH